MKLYKRIAAVLLACLLALSLAACGGGGGGGGSASASVTISSTTFPDSTFRAYVTKNFDTDGNGTLSASEIKAVTKIDVSDSGISDLTGIEYFTELTTLDCNNNSLTKLDVSKNTKLTELNCGINKLTSLDVSKNTSLTVLQCYYNQLTSLDVSKNTKLERLFCGANENLKSLDLSKNTSLSALNCLTTGVTSLDLSKTKITTNSETIRVDSTVNVTYAGSSTTTEPDSSATTEPETNNSNEIKWTYKQLSDGSYQLTGYDSTGKTPSGTVTLPTSIDGHTIRSVTGFINNQDITEIIIPSTYKVISSFAFAECTNLVSVTLPEGLESIEMSAFKRSGLSCITIPASVTDVGFEAFYNCTSLKSAVIKGALNKTGGAVFMYCKNLTSVIFTDTCKDTVLPASTFAYCSSLETVILPKNLTEIWAYAFEYCLNLRSVTGITKNLKSVGKFAFNGCHSLTTVGGEIAEDIVINNNGNTYFTNAIANMK